MEVFDARILSGRSFHLGDVGEDATAVVVNDAFVASYSEAAKPWAVGFDTSALVSAQGPTPRECAGTKSSECARTC